MTATDSKPATVPGWLDLDKFVSPEVRDAIAEARAELLRLIPVVRDATARIGPVIGRIAEEEDRVSTAGVGLDGIFELFDALSGADELRELAFVVDVLVQRITEESSASREYAETLREKYPHLFGVGIGEATE